MLPRDRIEKNDSLRKKPSCCKNYHNDLKAHSPRPFCYGEHIQKLELTDHAQTGEAAAQRSNTEFGESWKPNWFALRTTGWSKRRRITTTRSRRLQGNWQRTSHRAAALVCRGRLAEKQRLLETRGQEVGELTASDDRSPGAITCLELANKQTVKEALGHGPGNRRQPACPASKN